MSSPFLNPLHSFLPPSPSATPSSIARFALTNDFESLKLDQAAAFGAATAGAAPGEKDDLADIAAHLSLASPKLTKRRLAREDVSSVDFGHHLYRRSCSAYADPLDARKRMRRSASNLAVNIEEEEIQTASHDKIFSSCWLNDDFVAFGSKANRLSMYNTRHKRVFEVETIGRPDGDAKMPRLGLSGEPNDVCSGIYGLAQNPSGTLLASNGKYSCDAVVYQLPSMTPIRLLEGHQDAIFTMTWLNDGVLITGSRDGSVAVWNVYDEAADQFYCNSTDRLVDLVQAPIVRRWRHLPTPTGLEVDPSNQGKVRSIQMNRQRHALATLGAEGHLKLWDVNVFDVQRSVPLTNARSAVALAYNAERQLYAVGSLLHTDFYDVRLAKPLCMSADSLDGDWGVRSLAFGSGNTVAIGGGLGRVTFFDLRSGAYQKVKKVDLPSHRPLPTKACRIPQAAGGMAMLDDAEEGDEERVRCEIRTGRGWFRMDETMIKQLSTRDVRHAAYTLAFDPSGTRLFVGGGPLELGLMGAYAGLWL